MVNPVLWSTLDSFMWSEMYINRIHSPYQGKRRGFKFFHFGSDSSEVINLFILFFSLSLGFFSNFHIKVIWTIFLDRFDSLLLKCDMMTLFAGNFSGFWIFPGFSRLSSNLQISTVFINAFRWYSSQIKYAHFIFGKFF